MVLYGQKPQVEGLVIIWQAGHEDLEQITTDLKALGEKHFSEPHHSVERFLRPSE